MATRAREHTNRRGDSARQKVLLSGDRFLLLEAIRLALEARNIDVAVVGAQLNRLEEAIGAFEPGLVILDASTISIDGALRNLLSVTRADTSVVAITTAGVSIEAARLVSAGAASVIGLDAGLEELVRVVAKTLDGKAALQLERRYELEKLLRLHRATEQRRWLPFDELTQREREVFELVYAGLSAEQIADQACVSINTVRTHIRSILNKLNVNSQLAAVAMARSRDWFPESA